MRRWDKMRSIPSKLVTDLEASRDLKNLMDELHLWYLGRLEPIDEKLANYGDIHLAADKNTGEYVPFIVRAGRAYTVYESEIVEYLNNEVDEH